MNMNPKPPAKQKLLLQIVLTVVIFLGVINAALIARNIDTFVENNPNLNNVLAYAFAVCYLLTVIGSFYLWGFKKWGLYLVILAFLLIIAFNFYIGIEIQKLLLTIISFALIIVAVMPLRKFLR